MFSSKSDVSLPASLVYDRYQSGEGYHVVSLPYTGTFMPLKPDLSNRPSAPIIEDWVFDSEDESEAEPTQNAPSFVPPPKHVKSPRLSVNPIEHLILAEHLRQEIPKHVVPTRVLTSSKLVPLTTARPVTTVVPRPHVTRPRPAKNVATKSHPPPRRTINLRSSSTHSNFHHKVTTAKAP
nr:hypothetical protein [Tanacetum cinerariifolium]